MQREGIYIYGFVNSSENKSLGPHGIDEKEVCTFPYENIAAVVSDCEYQQLDLPSKETLLRNLAVYQAVIEEVMKGHHIIPVKFRTMVQGEEELKRTLEKGYGQISTNLKETENRIELDVAALWSDLDAILKEIGEEEGVRTLKKEAAAKPPDQVFEVKIRVGKLVKESLEKRKEECASHILDVLKKEAEDHLDHSIMDDSMTVNAAFLIDKDKQGRFEAKVDQLDRYYRDRINFRIVGPLPPYSFRTLEITKVDFTEVNEAREMFDLGEESTPMEIKETYREFSKKFHPDKFPGNAEAHKRFENIGKAYQVLMDYSQGDRCSFRETDVRRWTDVRRADQPGRA